MNAKEQASDDSKSQYALELQKTNQAQQEHYASVMPQIFQVYFSVYNHCLPVVTCKVCEINP